MREGALTTGRRLVGLEFMAIQHSAGRLDDVEDGGARGQQMYARVLHAAVSERASAASGERAILRIS